MLARTNLLIGLGLSPVLNASPDRMPERRRCSTPKARVAQRSLVQQPTASPYPERVEQIVRHCLSPGGNTLVWCWSNQSASNDPVKDPDVEKNRGPRVSSVTSVPLCFNLSSQRGNACRSIVPFAVKGRTPFVKSNGGVVAFPIACSTERLRLQANVVKPRINHKGREEHEEGITMILRGLSPKRPVSFASKSALQSRRGSV